MQSGPIIVCSHKQHVNVGALCLHPSMCSCCPCLCLELHLLSAHEVASRSSISQQPLWLTAQPLCWACWFLTCVHLFGETSVKCLAWFKLLVFALLACEGHVCLCILDASPCQVQDLHGMPVNGSSFLSFPEPSKQ